MEYYFYPMRKTFNYLVVIGLSHLLTFNLYSQETDLKVLLAKHVEAFNSQNIDVLSAGVSEDFIWFAVMSDSTFVEAEGRSSFTAAMKGYFDQFTDVKSEINDVVVVGNRISFDEKVSWTSEEGEMSQSSLGVYEFKKGLITRAWYFY